MMTTATTNTTNIVDECFTRCIEFDQADVVALKRNSTSSDDEQEVSVNIWQRCTSDESGVVWDAAILLAKYLEKSCRESVIDLSNWNILELGSGTGFLGIWTAALGASSVLMTDLPQNLNLIQRNVRENQSLIPQDKKIEVKSFDWLDRNQFQWNFMQWRNLDDINLVLIADCLYYQEGIEAIYTFIDWLLSHEKVHAQILISYEDRDEKMELCYQFVKKVTSNCHLCIQTVPLEELHPDYRSDDLHLLKISRRLSPR